MPKDYSGFTLAQMILQYQKACKYLEGCKSVTPKVKRENKEIGNHIRLRLGTIKIFSDPNYLPPGIMTRQILPLGTLVIFTGGKEGEVVGYHQYNHGGVVVKPTKKIQEGVETINLLPHEIIIKYVHN
jgi:hypothetical protein